MKTTIPRAYGRAKDPVCSSPTPSQVAFFAEVRATLLLLERRGCRLTHIRRGTPEQIAMRFLVCVLSDTLSYVEHARAEGRPLELRFPTDWSTPTLSMGPRPTLVIDLAAWRRKKHR